MSLRRLLIDVHTHCSHHATLLCLRSRSNVPCIFTRNTLSGQSEGLLQVLLILDDEPSGGQQVGPEA